ncbi:c-type cytochrome [Mesorhizobium sp. IMUNJ 23232]|uniref:c-type cytochrome n=1 Tax=Mesorhizobium sp. IMUNJ 23232 TaxID=3376064 RepID=UPI00379BEC2B
MGWCTATSAQSVDPAVGERLFRARCSACHSIDENQKRTGPHLHGIFGRQAASVEGADYSAALRELDLVWTAESLDTFIANPGSLAKGTRMTVRVPNPPTGQIS